MSTITTIQSTDLITNSRTVINTNFSNLNTDKIETSVLDTDTALAANSDSKIATQKAVKTYIDSGGGFNASEVTTGATHSLTTIAGQKVIVFVKGNFSITSAGSQQVDVVLKYNAVTKDTVTVYNENVTTTRAFALMYTETPGAATQNVTVTSSTGTLANVVIIVWKFKA